MGDHRPNPGLHLFWSFASQKCCAAAPDAAGARGPGKYFVVRKVPVLLL